MSAPELEPVHQIFGLAGLVMGRDEHRAVLRLVVDTQT
jgi:hypothetical protein